MLQMNELNMLDGDLDDDGLAAIASCVTNIETLVIGNHYRTNFTKKGICALAQGISKRSKPVSYQ